MGFGWIMVSSASALLLGWGLQGVWRWRGRKVGARRARLQRLAAAELRRVDRMDGYAFEAYLGKLFATLGYSSVVTQSSGDYGADLVLKRRGRVIAVQAKRYSKPVGLKAVQEVHTAMSFYGASEGWVVANTGYTKQAQHLASHAGVRLINRADLLDLIIESKKHH